MKSPVAPLTIAFSLIVVAGCGNGNFGSTNDSGSIASLSANDLNQSGSGKVVAKSADAAAADAVTKKECDASPEAQTADAAQTSSKEEESGCHDDQNNHDDQDSAGKSDNDEDCND